MSVPETAAVPASATWEYLTRPDELRSILPGTVASTTTAQRGRSAIRQILNKVDDRLLVIVGPCSLHDRETAVEYADRLREIAGKLSDDLFVVMRAYVEKPRTSFGWTGLAHAPDLFGPPDPEQGFRLARSILAEITGMTVPVAVEWLTAVAPAYLDDLVSWGCIGARTVEAQPYRHLASGLSMPIG